MLKGITKNGFEFELDESELDDMEFLETLAEAEENALAFPKICKMMLGEKQKKRLYDHLRNEKGKVPIEAVKDVIIEIMESSSEKTKNS